MFTLDAIKREASDSSYQRGNSYYRNNRIKRYSVEALGKDSYIVNAAVKGSDDYTTTVVIDVAKGSLAQWYCSCPYSFGGICKHAVAVALKFYYDGTKTTAPFSGYVPAKADTIRSNIPEANAAWPKTVPADTAPPADNAGEEGLYSHGEAMLLDELGLYRRAIQKYYSPGQIHIVFQQFNILPSAASIYNNAPSALHRRFSLKILVSEEEYVTASALQSAKSVKLDRGIIERVPGSYSILFDYITANGVYVAGIYYLAQTNIDMVFAMLKGLEGVKYGQPPEDMHFSDEIYKPDIRLATLEDGTTSITCKEDLTIIPGKYSTFVLKDNTIMKLSDDVPASFYIQIKNKPRVIGQRLGEKFFTAALPVLKNAFMVDESGLKKIEYRDVIPDVNIYVKYGKQSGELYVIPEIRYGEYLSINPFEAREIENYENFYYTAAKLKTSCSAESGNTVVNFRRDIYKEYQLYCILGDKGYLEPDGEGRLVVSGDDAVYGLIKEIFPKFPGNWKVFYDKGLENLKIKQQDVKINFDFSADIDNGLLEFDVEFHCGRLKITREQLFDYMYNNRKLLNIGGSFVEVSNREELDRLFAILQSFNKEDGKKCKFSGKLYQAVELDALIESSRQYSYKSSESYRNLIQELKSGKPVEKIPIPERFLKILRPYQVEGVYWMHFLRKYGFGGILADDMGLGKTLQTLVTLSIMSEESTSLIVCPKTLIHNWYNEIQKFAPGMKVLVAHGNSIERSRKIKKAREFDVVITSYPLLKRDIKEYASVEFEYCVIDEAQYIKNASTKTARSVKAVKAKFRLALTGTPLENSLTELWSVFDYIMPGFLGSEQDFKARYDNPVSRYGDMSRLTFLSKKIKPFMLRRTKKEMLKDLPPKIEQISYSELSTGQLVLYSKILEKVRKDLYDTVAKKGFERSQIEILAALTRLRQICNHPGLVDERLKNEKSISGKLDLFEELIEECIDGGHKVLVFSQFTKMLEILKGFLDKKKIKYSYLDGQSKDRQNIIEEFNSNEKVKIFLISIKAGGFGLNLTSADTVIVYDPWWNPMVEEQAADRAHRIGQEKTVNVYKLITKDTVEEKIQKLQERKRLLFDNVINENNEFIKKLSWEDLQEVLS